MCEAGLILSTTNNKTNAKYQYASIPYPNIHLNMFFKDKLSVTFSYLNKFSLLLSHWLVAAQEFNLHSK
jgi:hypothetical protein